MSAKLLNVAVQGTPLAMASVIYGYVRTTGQWETAPVPVEQPERQSEPV